MSNSPKNVLARSVSSVDALQEIHRAKLQKTAKSIEMLQDQLKGITRKVRFSSEGSSETIFDQDNLKDAESDDAKLEHDPQCQDIKDNINKVVECQHVQQCFIVRMHHNSIVDKVNKEDATTKTTTMLEEKKMIIADEENVNKNDEGYETPDESMKDEIKTHANLQVVDQCFNFLKSKDDDIDIKFNEANDESSNTTIDIEEANETESKLFYGKLDPEAIQVDDDKEESKLNVCADELKVYDAVLKKGMKHRRGSTLSWMAQKLTQKSCKSGYNRNKRPKFGPLFSFGISSHLAP